MNTTYDFVSSDDQHPVVPWDAYFMGMAILAAKRSDDPRTKVRILLFVSSGT